MQESCPVSFKKVDGAIIRINSFWVSLGVVLFLYTNSPIWLYILFYDFSMRLYGKKIFSPLSHLSIFTKKILKIESDISDAAAKRLAAHFGLLFVFLLILTSYLELQIAIYAVASIFLFCASLELLFNYCIGCKIYFLAMNVIAKK